VQLGLIMVINLGIGLYTPPIGTTLFISASIAKCSLGETTRELWPFFLVGMLVLLAVSYIPALTSTDGNLGAGLSAVAVFGSLRS